MRASAETYIYLLTIIVGGDREDDRNERTRKIITHSWNEEAQKETSGCEKFIEHKIQKITRELKKKQLVRKLITHSTIHNYLMPC